MRLDKFLKVSRLIKRRTIANSACDGGRVFVNDKEAKPSHKLKVGDIVRVKVLNVDTAKKRIALTMKGLH